MDGFGWPTEEGLVKIRSRAIECYPRERGMIRNAWTILEDEQNNFWFAAYRYGLLLLDQKQQYQDVEGYEELMPPDFPFYTGGIRNSNGNFTFSRNFKNSSV